jgi:hypothetical protein
MSILIKGIEMHREKKTTLTIFADGRVYENHGERLWGHGKDCIPWKAVPVPPHGRLIDADALEVIGYCGIPQGHEDTFDSGVMWLAEQIDKLPTIIPAEEGE